MSNQPPYDPQGGQPGGNPNQPPGGFGAPQGQPQQPGGYPGGQPQQPPQQPGGYPGAPQGGQPGQYPSAPQGGGYGSAPQMSGGGMGAPANVTKPKSIDLAQKLMYGGAALSLLGILASLFMRGSIRDAVRESLEGTSSGTVSESDIDAALNAGLAIAIVIGLIGVGLWLFMAKANGDGKSWARIVATILGGLNILFTIINFTQPTASGLAIVINVLSALLAAAILFLLWKPESTQYYNARSAPRM